MFYLRKSSGERQRFDLQKFRRSLFKAGARKKDVEKILYRINKEKPKSTLEVQTIAIEILKKENPIVADRYNLKHALMQLGPDGYRFELYIADLLAQLGYKTDANRIVPGACVDHEVDVIAQKNNHHYMIECKFHNIRGPKTDVKTTLYVQARFEDIQEKWQKTERKKHTVHQAWIVTNTQFTSEAIKYAACRNIKLLGWGYPAEQSLAEIIEENALFPITTLTSLNIDQKKELLQKGLVLCRDAEKHEKTLKAIGLNPSEIKNIIKESQAICKI